MTVSDQRCPSARTDKPLPLILLSLLVLAGIWLPIARAQTPFRIAGTVVNAADASPIPRCRLTAILASLSRGQARQPVEGQSDDHGRFSLDLPSAGTWRLVAAGRNVHTQAYDEHEGFFTGIVLTQAQPSYNVVFRARMDVVLAGSVSDEAGEAVRNAPVFLTAVDLSAAQPGLPPNARTQQTLTDDRGHYEFAGLEAGSYFINVRARPWYALQGGFPSPAVSPSAPSPDPSLDLVYPITWYPGTIDEASATPLVAHAGDRLQADFHLFPVPSAHLLIPSAPPVPAPPPPPGGSLGGVPGGSGAFLRSNAQVSLLLPNGSVQQVFGSYSRTSSGELDMGGLAPGTYQVTLPAERSGEPGRTTVLRIAAGGTVTEVGSGASNSSLSVSVDGDTSVDPSQLAFIDAVTGQTIHPSTFRGRPGNFNQNAARPQQQRRNQDAPAPPSPTHPDNPDGSPGLTQRPRPREASSAELTLDLPPGRYEVIVPGNSGAFLTGLTATGARAEGRFITLAENSAHLVVHLASGLASVEGTASLHGKPCAGALVLLIPATLGAPNSLATVRRDQSNSDGSFRIAGVIPGQYILLAIDHGWSVKWNDAATLRPYLLGGSPLELAPSASSRSTLQALAP